MRGERFRGDRPGGARVCWRCGCEWRDKDSTYRTDAPCPDCRASLRAEGIPAGAWRVKPNVARLGDTSHPLHPHRERRQTA